MKLFPLVALLCMAKLNAALVVTEVDGPPSDELVVISQPIRDDTGPTSFRYYAPRDGEPTKTDDWVFRKGEANGGVYAKYYYRDRDLGQTFVTGNEGFKLGAITVRLQPVDVKDADPAGAKVSLQLMKVTGEPVINDNGTNADDAPNGRSTWEKGQHKGERYTNPQWSTYASDWPWDTRDPNGGFRWPYMHFSDDYMDGEHYEHLAVANGGVVPDTLDRNDYMRWELTGDDQWELEPNTKYAILFLFTEPAEDNEKKRNIPLSNKNILPTGKQQDVFPQGHMIRRDGSSTDREAVFIRDVNDPADVEASRDAAEFPSDFESRLRIQPGTLGYPDVDTYRDLYFYMEKAPD